MKISPSLEWIREYVESVSDLVPIEKIVNIKGIKPQNNLRAQGVHAIISKYTDGTFRIVIMTYSKKVNPLTHEVTFIKYSKIDTLTHLAHELSHQKKFNYHCCDHKLLELKILKRFMTRLKKSGYHSEELSE